MDVKNAPRAQEELERCRQELPEAVLAYKPSGKTTGAAVAAMVLGAPFAAAASLVAAIGAALLTALVLTLFRGPIMWLVRGLPGLRSVAESHIGPFLFFVVATATVIAGAMACGWAMGKLIAALGRKGKNTNADTVAAIAAIGTFLLLFFGLWLGNVEYNPQMPELLRGWLGIVVGLVYSGIGAGMAATTGAASVAEVYLCENCDLFMTPHTWRVTRQSTAAIRNALACSEHCDPGQVRIGQDNPGEVRLITCEGCQCGYVDLHVDFFASWKEGELRDEWLTASKRLNARESQQWSHILTQAKEDSSAEQAEQQTPSQQEPSQGKENSSAEQAEQERRLKQSLAELDGRAEDDLKEEYASADPDRRQLISRHFSDKGWGSPVVRVPCTNCGAMVLPTTADATGGLCRPCHKGGEKAQRERRNQSQSRTYN